MNSPAQQALAALTEVRLARISNLAGRFFAGWSLNQHGRRRRRYRAGSGHEFLDYREYTAGDDPRYVDWRQSARLARPVVRRYHDETCSSWCICLDRSASMGIDGGSKWALAVQLAAACCYLLLNHGNRVGIITFSGDIDNQRPLGRGRAQYREILALLGASEVRAAGGGSHLESCAARLGRRTSVFVVGDFLAPDGMRKGLDRLAQLGGEVHALQVLSAHEIRLPDAPEVTVADVESGERRTLDVRRVRPVMREKLRVLQRDLQTQCRRRGMAYSLVHTTDLWHAAIVRHLIGLPQSHA